MQLTTDVAQLGRLAGSFPPECSSTTAFLQLLTLGIAASILHAQLRHRSCVMFHTTYCVVDDQNLICAHAHSPAV